MDLCGTLCVLRSTLNFALVCGGPSGTVLWVMLTSRNRRHVAYDNRQRLVPVMVGDRPTNVETRRRGIVKLVRGTMRDKYSRPVRPS